MTDVRKRISTRKSGYIWIVRFCVVQENVFET